MKHPSHACRRMLALALLAAPATSLATDDDVDNIDDGFASPIEGLLQNIARTGPQRAMGALIEEVCPGGISRGASLPPLRKVSTAAMYAR